VVDGDPLIEEEAVGDGALQRSEKIDKNSAGQNQIVRFAKSDSLIFPDTAGLNTKELGLQALIDISPPLSLSTKKCRGGLLEASLIVFVFVFAFFNILRICRRRGVKRRSVSKCLQCEMSGQPC
jgi:hypothetical protein